MSKRSRIIIAILMVATGVTAFAQWEGGGRRRGGGRGYLDTSSRNGVPNWDVDPGFETDLFTFARVRYESGRYGGGGYGGGRGGWHIDYRDSDLNFSLRLQQLTTLKVNPEPVIVDLDTPELFNYPFLYMIEPGSLVFRESEVAALRRYFLNGGFMMVDDFWGDEEYDNFEREIKRVFPDRPITEVPLEHEIFHCVYDLKEKPQIPAVGIAERYRGTNVTWEERWGSDTSKANYRAISDDDGRIMVFICHNTDLGDGWEQEAANPWYFEEFSVKKAYPMGINIVVYAMTH